MLTGVGLGQASEMRKIYGYGKHVIAHTEYSRMLAEHGILGLLSLILLIGISYRYFSSSGSVNAKFIKVLFVFLALLTMAHSAMRLCMPAFIYSFLFIHYRE